MFVPFLISAGADPVIPWNTRYWRIVVLWLDAKIGKTLWVSDRPLGRGQMLMLWPLAVTPGVTHFGAYHHPPDGNVYVYVTGHIQSWTNLVIPSIHGDIAKKSLIKPPPVLLHSNVLSAPVSIAVFWLMEIGELNSEQYLIHKMQPNIFCEGCLESGV